MIDPKLVEYDKRFEGRMNPRNTFYCDTCNKYYNGVSDTVIFFSYNNNPSEEDCVHGSDTEITKAIYDAHMKDLQENGFLDENLEE